MGGSSLFVIICDKVAEENAQRMFFWQKERCFGSWHGIKTVGTGVGTEFDIYRV